MIDDDLYLGQRKSNRGCIILPLLALLVAVVIWFLFLRDNRETPVDPDQPGLVAQKPLQEEQPSTGRLDPAPPKGTGEQPNPHGTRVTPYTDSPAKPPENSKPPRKPPAIDRSKTGGKPEPPPENENNPTDSKFPLTGDLATAKTMWDEGKAEEAREMVHLALQSEDINVRGAAAQLLSEWHLDQLKTEKPMKEKVIYKVKRGDTLGGIAIRNKTTVELIRLMNGIEGDKIRSGQKLQLLQGVFTIHVNVAQRSLTLKLNGRFFKNYLVGVGGPDTPTPTGIFTITERMVEPTWYPKGRPPVPYGSTDNLLGTRWLAWNKSGYGIHGTWKPETVGQAVSSGCVRLTNTQVEELHSLVPTGTRVIVQ